MVETFARIAGPLQGALGVLTAVSPAAAAILGAGTGASALNVLSGTAFGLLGFRGTSGAQRPGIQILGGVNVAVGLLGLLGIGQVGGVPMNATTVGNVINLGLGIGAVLAGFAARK
jgi:hypothetical protein